MKINIKDYNPEQITQLILGKNANLDIRYYIDKNFNATQMEQIRLGLLKKLDITLYANPAFSWEQMKEIRLGIENGLGKKINCLLNPELALETMRFYHLTLDYCLTLTNNASQHFDQFQLDELALGYKDGLNILVYANPAFSWEQMKEIRLGMKHGIPYYHLSYVDVNYPWKVMKELRLAQEAGFDLTALFSRYADKGFEWQQLREIRLGLEHGVDVTKYNKIYYDWQQMREIRLGLEAGIDTSSYSDPKNSAEEMRALREIAVLNKQYFEEENDLNNYLNYLVQIRPVIPIKKY